MLLLLLIHRYIYSQNIKNTHMIFFFFFWLVLKFLAFVQKFLTDLAPNRAPRKLIGKETQTGSRDLVRFRMVLWTGRVKEEKKQTKKKRRIGKREVFKRGRSGGTLKTDCSFPGVLQLTAACRLPKRTHLVALHGLVDEQQDAGDTSEEQQLHPHGHSAPRVGLETLGRWGFRDGQGDGADARDRSALRVGGTGVSVLGETWTRGVLPGVAEGPARRSFDRLPTSGAERIRGKRNATLRAYH